MKWLTEELPYAEDSIAWTLIDKDRGLLEHGRLPVPSLKQCCRTNDYFKHMKIIDDPLKKKFYDFEEMIQDIPESYDPYYLAQFRAKRKAEKALKKKLMK